jgi:hypothetical protein
LPEVACCTYLAATPDGDERATLIETTSVGASKTHLSPLLRSTSAGRPRVRKWIRTAPPSPHAGAFSRDELIQGQCEAGDLEERSDVRDRDDYPGPRAERRG